MTVAAIVAIVSGGNVDLKIFFEPIDI